MAKCYINTTFGYLEQIIYERDFTKNPEVEQTDLWILIIYYVINITAFF